jgi:hypothetical protein
MKSPTLFRTAKSSALLTKVLNAWNKTRKPIGKCVHNKDISVTKYSTWKLQKVLEQKPYLESISIRKPLDTIPFKIWFFSNYTLLPAIVWLFQTFLDAITCNLWIFLKICYILEVRTLQQVFHLSKRQK